MWLIGNSQTIIIIYKHDFDARPLQHLRKLLRHAVRRAMEITLQEISYEIRQMALSVVHAYIKRWPVIRDTFVR